MSQLCPHNVSLTGRESRPHQQPDQEFALHSHQERQKGQSHRYHGRLLLLSDEPVKTT